MRTLAFLLLLAMPCVGASIPSIEARSPLRPGLWWDPERPGQGVEIQPTAEGLFLVWYSYRSDGSPIWWTAQGGIEGGRFEAPLLEHAWRTADDSHAGFEAVGSVRIEIAHAEAMVLHWSVGGQEGAWPLRPFLVPGPVPEVDPSALWYAPERSGFGLSLIQRGSLRFAVLYGYDADGEPTWRAGDNGRDAAAELPLKRFQGTCPGCPAMPAPASAGGSLALQTGGEGQLLLTHTEAGDTLHPQLTEPQALQPLGVAFADRVADRMLVHLHDEATLTRHLHEGLLAIHGEPWSRQGGIDFSAPPPAEGVVSATNVQVEGVDELARLAADGERVFALEQGTDGRAPGRLRSARLDTGSATLADVAVSTIALDPRLDDAEARGMLLTEQRLVTIHANRIRTYPSFGPIWLDPLPWSAGVFQVDLLDRNAAPGSVPLLSAVIDGHLLAARRVGDSLILLHRFTPHLDGLAYSGEDPEIATANAELLASTPLHSLLPSIRINGVGEPLVDARRVLLPPRADRQPRADMMLITTIDIGNPERRESLAVMGYLDAFHVAPDSVYLASSRYATMQDPIAGAIRRGFTTTDLHRVDLLDGTLDYRGSGSVEGYLHWDPDRASFRMAEREGRLFVVSESSDGIWGEWGRHRLTVLEPSAISAGFLRTLSWLPNDQRPQAIGKPGESLYGTRFVGDRLYAVTFLTIDPLYVIDLADPAEPYIAGEVDLPGFSDYLHPLPGGLLLGFGQDAIVESGPGGPFAWFAGLQLSLFDVSDASRPTLLQQLDFGRRGSDSALLRHHQAFSLLPATAESGMRFTVPMKLHGEDVEPPPGTPPHHWYPWTRSGLFRFALEGQGAAARLVELAPMVTRAAASGDSESWRDGGMQDGRAVLFEGGSLYLDGDRFWIASWDLAGGLRGPY